jgi:hypothetical protein
MKTEKRPTKRELELEVAALRAEVATLKEVVMRLTTHPPYLAPMPCPLPHFDQPPPPFITGPGTNTFPLHPDVVPVTPTVIPGGWPWDGRTISVCANPGIVGASVSYHTTSCAAVH